MIMVMVMVMIMVMVVVVVVVMVMVVVCRTWKGVRAKGATRTPRWATGVKRCGVRDTTALAPTHGTRPRHSASLTS